MSNKHYNVAMIGYGWASTAHIAAINATNQAQVTAVYSSRKLDPAELSARHGGQIKTYTDLAAMLGDSSIHAVSICSYPHDHAKHAIAAAKAGKHMIIEKPLALNWDDCQKVRDAVQKAKVKVCVCFECRFSSQFRTVKAIIDKGLLGRIHYGEVDYYHGIGPWYGQYRWNTKKESGGSPVCRLSRHGRLAAVHGRGR